MNQQYIVNHGDNRSLILFFAGWGMDGDAFASLSRDGYDIMAVWDYRDGVAFDLAPLARYAEIVVVAWSMGVYYADRFVKANPQLPITKCVAVNGTLLPIDDVVGIPERVYRLTMPLPDSRAVDKFYGRICGSPRNVEALLPRRPQRPVDELRDELAAIYHDVTVNAAAPLHANNIWDEVVISGADLIFPPANMQRAWDESGARVTLLPDAHHIIDFQWLVDVMFVDKPLIADKFGAADSYDEEATDQRRVATRIAQLAAETLAGRPASNRDILEIGCGSGMLTRMYQPIFSDSRIEAWDLAPRRVPSVNGNSLTFTACDAETAITGVSDESVDILFSSSTIQWFNSPAKFVGHVCRVLRPGGVALISYYSRGTFSALEGVAGLRYTTVPAEVATSRGLTFDSIDEHSLLSFDTPADALRHIRNTGVNSLNRRPLNPAATRRLMRALATPDGRGATLDFNTTYIIIQKPE